MEIQIAEVLSCSTPLHNLQGHGTESNGYAQAHFVKIAHEGNTTKSFCLTVVKHAHDEDTMQYL